MIAIKLKSMSIKKIADIQAENVVSKENAAFNDRPWMYPNATLAPESALLVMAKYSDRRLVIDLKMTLPRFDSPAT